MNINKTTTIANFNCTFGKDVKPMLTYFEEIIYPAFTKDYTRVVGDDVYFFKDVCLKKMINDRIILQGMLVRKTKLEVKTEYDDESGDIKFTHKFYDSAPISLFTLFLDNHRLLYTTNQKGSPNIKSFAATIREFIKIGVQEYNEPLEKNDKIQYPIINVVDVPSAKSIEERMKDVSKIRTLKFRFFNPNGDFDSVDSYDFMFDELREYGSTNATITINSPTNMSVVKEKIAKSKGFAEIKADVRYKNGSEGKLNNNSMSEKFNISLPEESSVEVVSNVTMETLKNNDLIKEVNLENKLIYDENKHKIEQLLN